MQKTAGKNTKYYRNETILKIGHLAKAIDFAKWSAWLKNSNGQKGTRNDSTSRLELFCAKNRWKKHQIFQKWDHLKNRPSCKVYRLCKMVSLGQKIQRAKNSLKNDSTSTLELFCAKNRCKKKNKYWRNKTFLKIDHLAKAIDFAKWSVWVQNLKWPKTFEKRFYNHVRAVVFKNRWKKNQIFEKWDHFDNRPSCQGYRLCKMVSLGQKFKWPKTFEKRFYKQVRVVLCKKPLQKTPNIREMRPFWKSPILQRL